MNIAYDIRTSWFLKLWVLAHILLKVEHTKEVISREFTGRSETHIIVLCMLPFFWHAHWCVGAVVYAYRTNAPVGFYLLLVFRQTLTRKTLAKGTDHGTVTKIGLLKMEILPLWVKHFPENFPMKCLLILLVSGFSPTLLDSSDGKLCNRIEFFSTGTWGQLLKWICYFD